MKKILALMIALNIIYTAKAGPGDYAAASIPAELLVNANAVKRLEELRFTISGLHKTTFYHHYVFTVLNEKGDQFARAIESYDQLHTVSSIGGTLYDASGKKIKSLKKADIKDYSGTDESSLADDNRIKAHSFYWKNYPYTVEYEVVLTFNHTMYFPRWVPLENEELSVENSRLTVICPANYSFRFKAFNYSGAPKESVEKGKKVFEWEVKHLNAIKNEYASPPWHEMTTVVYLAPATFKMQDYEGSMNTWEEYGRFNLALINGRGELPGSVKEKVHQLTDGITGTREKIEKLYAYHQSNTRYISIQLGIGGWQPFDATYVATRKYGDCKALSNFMSALLKEAGIKSYYTLIKAGRGNNSLLTDFPSNQFNHVILCAVDKEDTIWLECTSQTLQPGYLGDFTCDRYALLITEEGGKLVKTPKYGINENLQIRKTTAQLDEKGNLSVRFSTNYTGLQQDGLHGMIHGLSKDKVLQYLKNEIDLPDYDVRQFNYQQEQGTLPSIIESLDITAKNYAQVTGKRLFIAPNILTKSTQKLSANDHRKFDVVPAGMDYRDIDSVIIRLPAGYVPETVPPHVQINTPFGSYQASVKIRGDSLLYFRKMERITGRFPAGDYNKLVKFTEQVYKADRQKVVFVKESF